MFDDVEGTVRALNELKGMKIMGLRISIEPCPRSKYEDFVRDTGSRHKMSRQGLPPSRGSRGGKGGKGDRGGRHGGDVRERLGRHNSRRSPDYSPFRHASRSPPRSYPRMRSRSPRRGRSPPHFDRRRRRQSSPHAFGGKNEPRRGRLGDNIAPRRERPERADRSRGGSSDRNLSGPSLSSSNEPQKKSPSRFVPLPLENIITHFKSLMRSFYLTLLLYFVLQ